MSVRTQLKEVKDKNRLISELAINSLFLAQNISLLTKPTTEQTAEFKDLCLALLETMDEIRQQFDQAKNFIPSFPVEGEMELDTEIIAK